MKVFNYSIFKVLFPPVPARYVRWVGWGTRGNRVLSRGGGARSVGARNVASASQCQKNNWQNVSAATSGSSLVCTSDNIVATAIRFIAARRFNRCGRRVYVALAPREPARRCNTACPILELCMCRPYWRAEAARLRRGAFQRQVSRVSDALQADSRHRTQQNYAASATL